jgi:protein-S-isoprenylcysteine O-methyltransferase Ste14
MKDPPHVITREIDKSRDAWCQHGNTSDVNTIWLTRCTKPGNLPCLASSFQIYIIPSMKYTFRQLGVVWLTIVAVQPVSCFVFPGSSSVTTSIPSLDLRHKPPLKIVPSTSSQLHSVAPEIWTSFLPPAMGFVKSEWTVSYGYGFATSLSALSLLKRIPITTDNPIFPLQAAALIFYGLRLNAFLFIRNRISSRMQEFQKSMEERASARGSRIGRAPIVVSCGLLYYALFSPLLLTAMVGGSLKVPSVAMLAMKGLVGMQWIGFLMGAVGDFTKSYVKKSENDEKFLVTSGIFSLLRHPNYTGELETVV